MKTPMSLCLPEGDLSIFIKDAFETYGKWKMEREIHLQAIRRAYNLKAIREACQQYEQWRQVLRDHRRDRFMILEIRSSGQGHGKSV